MPLRKIYTSSTLMYLSDETNGYFDKIVSYIEKFYPIFGTRLRLDEDITIKTKDCKNDLGIKRVIENYLRDLLETFRLGTHEQFFNNRTKFTILNQDVLIDRRNELEGLIYINHRILEIIEDAIKNNHDIYIK